MMRYALRLQAHFDDYKLEKCAYKDWDFNISIKAPFCLKYVQ